MRRSPRSWAFPSVSRVPKELSGPLPGDLGPRRNLVLGRPGRDRVLAVRRSCTRGAFETSEYSNGPRNVFWVREDGSRTEKIPRPGRITKTRSLPGRHDPQVDTHGQFPAKTTLFMGQDTGSSKKSCFAAGPESLTEGRKDHKGA